MNLFNIIQHERLVSSGLLNARCMGWDELGHWVADLQCRLLSVVVAAAYQITRGARVERRRCCWWASDSSQSRAKVLWTPHGPGLAYRQMAQAMCQVCKLVTAHGRCPASPPVYALFTFLVRMLKRRIRTIHAPPPQISNLSRPFRQHENPTVPRDWTESKFHCCGFRGILAKNMPL